MPFQNILLIDDDEEDQEIFLAAVEEVSPATGCTCLSDATGALASLTAKDIRPDVIFLDLNMPVMNGRQFLQRIKQSTLLEDIPVVIFTTSSDPATIQQMKDMGAHDFITKPSSYDELVETLAPFIT